MVIALAMLIIRNAFPSPVNADLQKGGVLYISTKRGGIAEGRGSERTSFIRFFLSSFDNYLAG